MNRSLSHTLGALAWLTVLGLAVAGSSIAGDGIRASPTYRGEVVGKRGVVATGRHYAAEASMRMLALGGNAVDAGVAATCAAAVTEISHFGLGGEVPITLYLADRNEVVVVVNGQARRRRVPRACSRVSGLFRVAAPLCLRLQRGAACGAGGVMAWERVEQGAQVRGSEGGEDVHGEYVRSGGDE